MFRALGPLDVTSGSRRCRLTSPRQRAVLAILMCAEGRAVSVQSLVDQVWNGNPPADAVGSLRSHISRLRALLREVVGERAEVEPGALGLYRLRVDDPDEIDLLRFKRLRREAGAAARTGERERAVDLLREAAGLFRGEPLAGFTDDWALAHRQRLMEDLRAVQEERIALELDLGRHDGLTGELRALVAQDPLAEKLVGLLMLALHRNGRTSAALGEYRALCSRLEEETGQSPGAALARLHRRILAEDPALMPSAPERERRTGTGAPCTLPRDIKDFTGRTAELRELLARCDGRNGAVPVTVVHGMSGVGKSALAVHAAHRVRDRYPDGVYHVRLRGHDQEPSAPADALATLVYDAGVPVPKVPQTLAGWVSLWRSWTADRRLLVVLDDARDEEQVRPLLPGSSGSGVIVTSTRRLARLEGAEFVALGVMSTAEAGDMFARIAGAVRVGDAFALQRVIDLCGHQPLALRLAATRFRHRDAWAIGDLAEQLARSADPLDEIDPKLASAFRLSYVELAAPARGLFRRLALHPGPDFSGQLVRSLVDDEAVALRGVEDLIDSHLLEEHVRGRYRFHSLIRSFAQRVFRAEEPESMREETTWRLLSHYLTAADAADRLAHPLRRRFDIPAACQSAHVPELRDRDEALSWLDLEKANLLAAAQVATAASPAHAKLFPHVLLDSFPGWGARHVGDRFYEAAIAASRSRGDWRTTAHSLVERAELLCEENHRAAEYWAQEAIRICRTHGDRHTEADAHVQLARSELAAGHHERIHEHLRRALPLYQSVGDRQGEEAVRNLRGVALGLAGAFEEALDQFRVTHALHRRIGNPHGTMRALNNMGEVLYLARKHGEAREKFDEALVLAEHFGSRREIANLHNNLANIYRETGQTQEAFTYYRRALDGYRSGQEARSQADAHINVGRAHLESGQTAEAMTHFRRAVDIARQINNAFEVQRALIGIASGHLASREYPAALDTYREALGIAEQINVPGGQAQALEGMQEALLRTGSTRQARECGLRALEIYRRLGTEDDASRVQRRLSDPGTATAV